MRSLVWFKGNDLRIADNPALFHATSASPSVTALFILSPVEETSHNRSAIQMDYLLRSLADLSTSLWTKHKIPMLVKTAGSAAGVFDIMRENCTKLDVKKVYFNNQYELDESRRDNKIQRMLETSGVSVSRFDSDVVIKPGTLVSKASGKTYQVYTPFRKAWAEHVKSRPSLVKELDVSTEWRNYAGTLLPDKVPISLAGFELSDERRAKMIEFYPVGEDLANEKLQAFAKYKVTHYQRDRDFPSMESTRILSPKQCINAAKAMNAGKLDSGDQGAIVWIQEVIWREFYKNIMFVNPRVCMYKPYKMDTESIPWITNDAHYTAWCKGQTGYPLVDAAMRQLAETGWMHNRARMVVSSFLSKHLLLDWRLGEKWFSQNQIDTDFASNNGGWQWSASTGTDSQPYFRVFNPTLQAERFDKEANYIQRWVPELRGLKAKDTFEPTKRLGSGKVRKMGYYAPIVDHVTARKRAIAAFKDNAGKEEGEEKPSKKAKTS